MLEYLDCKEWKRGMYGRVWGEGGIESKGGIESEGGIETTGSTDERSQAVFLKNFICYVLCIHYLTFNYAWV